MFHGDDMFMNWFYEILNNQNVLSLFPARNFAGDLPPANICSRKVSNKLTSFRCFYCWLWTSKCQLAHHAHWQFSNMLQVGLESSQSLNSGFVEWKVRSPASVEWNCALVKIITQNSVIRIVLKIIDNKYIPMYHLAGFFRLVFCILGCSLNSTTMVDCYAEIWSTSVIPKFEDTWT